MACYWLMMRSFHCPNLVRIGSNAFLPPSFGRPPFFGWISTPEPRGGWKRARRPYETKPDLSSFQQEDPQLARTREMQRRDPELSEIIDFLENDTVPPNDKLARKLLLTSDTFYIGQDGLLYHLDQNQKRNNHEA